MIAPDPRRRLAALAAIWVACTPAASTETTSPQAATVDDRPSAAALAGPLPIGSTLRTTADASFRAGASASAALLDVLAEGTLVVTVHRTTPQDLYWNVDHGGAQGWVHAGDLALVSLGGGGGGSGGAGGAGGAAGGAGGAGGATTGRGVPAFATFHLNYTANKDWSKCAERDFVVFDMFDTPAADFAACEAMGARTLCYSSSQFEDWRPDVADFGALGDALDGWAGERWVDPTDAKNLAVMKARVDVAVSRGCDGVDLDNIDRDGHEAYVAAIFDAARAKGLLVSQKNAPEKIALFWDKVDMYQNEQCQAFGECGLYEGLGRPVYNIEYTACKVVPHLFSHRKHVDSMDAWEGPCSD